MKHLLPKKRRNFQNKYKGTRVIENQRQKSQESKKLKTFQDQQTHSANRLMEYHYRRVLRLFQDR